MRSVLHVSGSESADDCLSSRADGHSQSEECQVSQTSMVQAWFMQEAAAAAAA